MQFGHLLWAFFPARTLSALNVNFDAVTTSPTTALEGESCEIKTKLLKKGADSTVPSITSPRRQIPSRDDRPVADYTTASRIFSFPGRSPGQHPESKGTVRHPTARCPRFPREARTGRTSRDRRTWRPRRVFRVPPRSSHRGVAGGRHDWSPQLFQHPLTPQPPKPQPPRTTS